MSDVAECGGKCLKNGTLQHCLGLCAGASIIHQGSERPIVQARQLKIGSREDHPEDVAAPRGHGPILATVDDEGGTAPDKSEHTVCGEDGGRSEQSTLSLL